MRPVFTLTVVTSQDGFIARAIDDAPQSWASSEEQDLFFADVEAADWAIMGRHTHEAADRPERRRIVFSAAAGAGEWRRPTQLWLDPARLGSQDLADRVAHIRPMHTGLILGGTRVHVWFLGRRAIDRVHLTVEPVTFGVGLPMFTGHAGAPGAVLAAMGFERLCDRALNAAGTRHSVWQPKPA